MDLDPAPEVACLDHGYVALTAVMGDDRTPARTARTSFRNRNQPRTEDEDARLVEYLVRNKHNTPLEFCQLRFYVKMPILVARQFVRQRTQSINEVSYRYVQAAREFYVPAPDRWQRKAENKKQGSADELVDDPAACEELYRNACNYAFDAYEEMLAEGLAPEISRGVLPCATYTEWYTQMNLHNLFHMLALRVDDHAQYETRTYAEGMLHLARAFFPRCIAAWEKHVLKRAA